MQLRFHNNFIKYSKLTVINIPGYFKNWSNILEKKRWGAKKLECFFRKYFNPLCFVYSSININNPSSWIQIFHVLLHLTWLQDVSSPNFSTPNLNPGLFNLDFFKTLRIFYNWYSLINMRQLHIFFKLAKPRQAIVCFYLFLPEFTC